MNRNEWANIYKSEVVREEKGCPTMNITYRGCNLAWGGGGDGEKEEVCHVLFRKMKKSVLILEKKCPNCDHL